MRNRSASLVPGNQPVSDQHLPDCARHMCPPHLMEFFFSVLCSSPNIFVAVFLGRNVSECHTFVSMWHQWLAINYRFQHRGWEICSTAEKAKSSLTASESLAPNFSWQTCCLWLLSVLFDGVKRSISQNLFQTLLFLFCHKVYGEAVNEWKKTRSSHRSFVSWKWSSSFSKLTTAECFQLWNARLGSGEPIVFLSAHLD